MPKFADVSDVEELPPVKDFAQQLKTAALAIDDAMTSKPSATKAAKKAPAKATVKKAAREKPPAKKAAAKKPASKKAAAKKSARKSK
jgi:hypothetical protein